MRLANARAVRVAGGDATGMIGNAEAMPALLRADDGREVVERTEERMAAPRRRGFRARLPSRELRPAANGDLAPVFCRRS